MINIDFEERKIKNKDNFFYNNEKWRSLIGPGNILYKYCNVIGGTLFFYLNKDKLIIKYINPLSNSNKKILEFDIPVSHTTEEQRIEFSDNIINNVLTSKLMEKE